MPLPCLASPPAQIRFSKKTDSLSLFQNDLWLRVAKQIYTVAEDSFYYFIKVPKNLFWSSFQELWSSVKVKMLIRAWFICQKKTHFNTYHCIETNMFCFDFSLFLNPSLSNLAATRHFVSDWAGVVFFLQPFLVVCARGLFSARPFLIVCSTFPPFAQVTALTAAWQLLFFRHTQATRITALSIISFHPRNIYHEETTPLQS